MRFFSAIVLFGTLFFTGTQAHALCGGCGELVILEKKLTSIKSGDEAAATPVITKAIRAVKAMPTKKGKKLEAEQILAISRVLAAAFDKDPFYSIIDSNFELFKANQKEFFATFKTFPKKDAENLASMLDIKLGEAEGGQDSDPDAEPAPAALKKK